MREERDAQYTLVKTLMYFWSNKKRLLHSSNVPHYVARNTILVVSKRHKSTDQNSLSSNRLHKRVSCLHDQSSSG